MAGGDSAGSCGGIARGKRSHLADFSELRAEWSRLQVRWPRVSGLLRGLLVRRFLFFSALLILAYLFWTRVMDRRLGDLIEAPRYLPPPPVVICGAQCGVERWQVKTLSDPQRDQVNLTAVHTTLEELVAIERPAYIDYRRAAPVELTTYQIDAYLAGWKGENDSDIHLILAGLSDQRATMIAEIPDPACSGACASGLSADFASAREVVAHILAEPNPTDNPIILRVTGVGFFDRNHGQTGAAPNFLELHPVLRVERR